MYQVFKSIILSLILLPIPSLGHSADTKHEFVVDPNESYSDYIQFEDGHAQGACVFYFKSDTPGFANFNRLVVFCEENEDNGRIYEDAANKRIVWSRPISEFDTFSRIREALGKSTVYGAWVTRSDGKVLKIALQISSRNGAPLEPSAERPELGAPYTGK